MTERVYRLVIGISMIMFLFMQWHYALYLLMALLLIEALTNWRIPILISRLRYPQGEIKVTEGENQNCTIHYEAERILRWLVFALIALSSLFYSDQLWFFPWFIGLMLLLSGVTGICPMVMFFRRVGFR